MFRPHLAQSARGGAARAALGATLSLAGLSTGAEPDAGAAPLPPPIASYTLRARLDESSHTIHGEGTIRWTNASSVSTDELYFHLYLNAFKNTETLFNRSPFTRARSGRSPQSFGQISIESLRAREWSDTDLGARMEPHSPGDPNDETDRRVQLPAAVAPGEGLTLDIKWTAVLPDIVERTGHSRDFYFAGQWFPKLARLEGNGHWAHFAFHPHAEFYSDFGDYDVLMDVPAPMVVGATGHRESDVTDGGRRQVRHRAEGVHDFAWTAWQGFEQRHERVLETDVHLLYPPGHERNAAVTLATLRFALPHFSARYGPYPYPDLTVVHPPEHAGAAGGMEYPTLITTGGAWHASYWSRAVELVTLHELGHQWFYGLVATHEARWPFLDEGLTSYAESVAAEALFGPTSASDLLGFELSAEPLRRAAMQLGPHDAPLALPASDFVTFEELGALVYSKTALLLTTIANLYGKAALDAALRTYAERYRFRHPRPDDLLQVLRETLGPAAAANVGAVVLRGDGVNYVARDLRTARLSEPRGIASAWSQWPTPAAGSFESRVNVFREGELQLPVEVLLITATGERITKLWSGEGRVEVMTHTGDSPVVSAVVDPSSKILIEESLLDNAVAKHQRPPIDTLERALYVFQLLLGWLAP